MSVRKLIPILLAGAGLAAAQNGPVMREKGYWVRDVQGAVSVAPGGRLRIESTGNVTVRGADGQSVTYSVKMRVRAGDAREAESIFDRMNVKTGTEGGWTYIYVTPPRLASMQAELSVSAPRALRQVRAETDGGDVQALDLDGDFAGESGGGRISVDRIGGRSELRTAGGNIEVGNVSGQLRALSGGGVIRVAKAGVGASLETAGGEIFLGMAGGPVQASTGGGNIRIEHAAGTVTARTAGGLIQVEQAGGIVTAESSGGAIQVNSANGVRCESAGGAIRLRDVTGAVRAFANSGSILAELMPGKALADSTLSTNAGDIRVVIPSNVAVTVQAMNESGGSGRIVSDFPQVRVERGASLGGPAMAEGSLNGGGPMLRVNVIGGTIYLQKAK